MPPVALYAITIFLSAFLLFQVQPLIAKMILPWFGGCSSVWSTCMLFFQATLVLGYLYAHGLHERLSARRQAILHSALLLVSLAQLPVIPDSSWKGGGIENPSFRLLGLLAVTVGLPYFLLSTTTPLVQAWYARTHAGAVPYRLFALSNLASMLALLSYPVLFEPNLTTRTQAWIWSGAYAAFALLCVAAAWWSSGAREQTCGAGQAFQPDPPNACGAGWGTRLLWVVLPACASILLLAITAHLTQDIAAIPFLWILPLSLYLLSFIICFEAPRLYRRAVFLGLLAPALGVMGYMLWPETESFEILPAIFWCSATLFVCSMVCHGELARLRPHPRQLTAYYLMISIGGAVGGLFVGLLAPSLFDAFYELPAGLALCAALAATVLFLNYPSFFKHGWGRLAASVIILGVAGYSAVLIYSVRYTVQGYRVVERNFYGQLRVRDADEEDGVGLHRKLLHGIINHGEQILSPEYRRKPTTYYCSETGVARAMTTVNQGSPRRIGVLGLGCGTLLAFGRKGDVFRVYEINPLVLRLAQTEFTYLADTPARVEIVLGDGRLALERDADQHFDVLVMDAFSGDSIPVHLVTREAFATYFRHLKPGGVLAVNISNKYVNLRPVMERLAGHFGKIALCYEFTPDDEDPVCFSASWVLIMDPTTRAAFPSGKQLEPYPDSFLWTDDFSNLYRVLK